MRSHAVRGLLMAAMVCALLGGGAENGGAIFNPVAHGRSAVQALHDRRRAHRYTVAVAVAGIDVALVSAPFAPRSIA